MEKLNKLYQEWTYNKDNLFKIVEAEKKNINNDSLVRDLYNSEGLMTSFEEFKNILIKFRDELGIFHFSKKKSINKILESKELLEMERIRNQYMQLWDFRWGHQYLSQCIRGLLASRSEYTKAYSDLRNLAIKEPYVNFLIILQNLLRGKKIEGINEDVFLDSIKEFNKKTKE